MIYITKLFYTLLVSLFLLSISVFIDSRFSIIIYLLIFSIIGIAIADFFTIPGKKTFTIQRHVEKYLSIGTFNKVSINVETRTNKKVEIKDLYPNDFEYLNTGYGEYSIKPFKKGEYVFTGTQIRVEGFFKLTGRQYQYTNKTIVKVYPNIIELRKYLKLISRNRLEESGYKTAHFGGNLEFDFLREYNYGDNYRDINWKATAKKDFPVTQINKKEIERNVLAIFDCGRMMTTKYYDLTKLDYSINASLLLAASVIKGNDKFGMLAFDNSIKLFMKPQNTKNVYHTILAGLYRIEPDFVKSYYQKAYEFVKKNITKNTIVFIFSEIYNKIVSEDLISFAKLLKKNHIVKIISFEESEQLAEGSKISDLARFSIQVKMLAEKKQIIADLHSKGIETITVTSNTIQKKVVNTYLSI